MGENCIDECEAGVVDCSTSMYSECVSTGGSGRCECLSSFLEVSRVGDAQVTCGCETGYEVNMAGDTCVDINECADGPEFCSSSMYSACANTPGSARCNCISNFVEESRVNPTSVTCGCATGYAPNVGGDMCVDIDECVEGLVDCINTPYSVCVNSLGSAS